MDERNRDISNLNVHEISIARSAVGVDERTAWGWNRIKNKLVESEPVQELINQCALAPADRIRIECEYHKHLV